MKTKQPIKKYSFLSKRKLLANAACALLIPFYAFGSPESEQLNLRIKVTFNNKSIPEENYTHLLESEKPKPIAFFNDNHIILNEISEGYENSDADAKYAFLNKVQIKNKSNVKATLTISLEVVNTGRMESIPVPMLARLDSDNFFYITHGNNLNPGENNQYPLILSFDDNAFERCPYPLLFTYPVKDEYADIDFTGFRKIRVTSRNQAANFSVDFSNNPTTDCARKEGKSLPFSPSFHHNSDCSHILLYVPTFSVDERISMIAFVREGASSQPALIDDRYTDPCQNDETPELYAASSDQQDSSTIQPSENSNKDDLIKTVRISTENQPPGIKKPETKRKASVMANKALTKKAHRQKRNPTNTLDSDTSCSGLLQRLIALYDQNVHVLENNVHEKRDSLDTINRINRSAAKKINSRKRQLQLKQAEEQYKNSTEHWQKQCSLFLRKLSSLPQTSDSEDRKELLRFAKYLAKNSMSYMFNDRLKFSTFYCSFFELYIALSRETGEYLRNETSPLISYWFAYSPLRFAFHIMSSIYDSQPDIKTPTCSENPVNETEKQDLIEQTIYPIMSLQCGLQTFRKALAATADETAKLLGKYDYITGAGLIYENACFIFKVVTVQMYFLIIKEQVTVAELETIISDIENVKLSLISAFQQHQPNQNALKLYQRLFSKNERLKDYKDQVEKQLTSLSGILGMMIEIKQAIDGIQQVTVSPSELTEKLDLFWSLKLKATNPEEEPYAYELLVRWARHHTRTTSS